MIAEVIVDVLNSEVDRIFDYLIPEDMALERGDRIIVPFGKREIEGFVISIKDNSDYPVEKLKAVLKRFPENPIILPELMDLIAYMKDLYHLRYVDIIRLVVPSQIRGGKVKELIEKWYKLADDEKIISFISSLNKNSKNPPKVIEYLKSKGEETLSLLNKMFTNACISKMVNEGVLIENLKKKKRQVEIEAKVSKEIVLTPYQDNAVNAVLNANAKTFLLHGVTGSGKTEVYMHIIKTVLNSGKTAIMLVPEISLTPQVVGLFKGRFGDDVAVLHSKLSMGERFDEWYRIYNEEAKIVIGPRSAVFAPIKNLGVIIIDEEHDSSYLSDSNPRYYTHEVAEFRSKANDCPLVLGSATPNLDTYYKAKNGEYELLELPTRANQKEMPKVEIVDMCAEFRGGNKTPFSEKLLAQLSATIERKQQAILFINRRGFSTFLMCRECGYIPKCESCDVSLVYHRDDNELKCHYCGKRYRVITRCPECGSEEIKLGNAGTQKVCADLKEYFKDVPIFRMDNDTTSTKDAHAKILGEFGKTKPAILVGTQMVAKGHDFPEVSLVGILDADLSLFFNDYRANERTFQLITQVAGRAGRSEIEGKVVLQTYFPKHFVYNLVANYDFKRFYEKEINLRETTLFPPFSKVLRILVTSEKEDIARDKTHELFIKMKEFRMKRKEDFYFLEAMKAPINKIKDKFRFQIVTRFSAENSREIIDEIFKMVEDVQSKNLQIFIETNPQHLS